MRKFWTHDDMSRTFIGRSCLSRGRNRQKAGIGKRNSTWCSVLYLELPLISKRKPKKKSRKKLLTNYWREGNKTNP